MNMMNLLKKAWGNISDGIKAFVVIILVVSVIIFLAYHTFLWKNYPKDNVVEELIEDMIKEKSGLDIDLSPICKKYFNPNFNFLII